MTTHCTHTGEIRDVSAHAPAGCEECLKTGDEWVALRQCLSCGHVGCCDSSKNQHARKHFEATTHPIIEAYKEDNAWKWCYVDNIYL